MKNEILKWISEMCAGGLWLEPQSGVGICVVAGSGLYAALPKDSLTFWPVLLMLGVSYAVPGIMWWLVRHRYLKGGGTTKIGLCVQTLRVPVDEVHSARDRLIDLVRTSKVSRSLSIRMIPRRLLNSDQGLEDFKRRYGFTIVVGMEYSPSTDGSNRRVFQWRTTPIHAERLGNDFKEATSRHIASLFRADRSIQSLIEETRGHARGLYRTLLLLLAVNAYSTRDLSTARIFARALDEDISKTFRAWEYPRRAIRWLESESYCGLSHFPGSDPPGPDILESACTQLKQAEDRFGTEFPPIQILWSRNLFFLGQLDAALDVLLRTQRVQLTEVERTCVLLNLMVLNLLLGRYERAAAALTQFERDAKPQLLDWQDLIGFADAAREIYEDAVFLQSCYRLIAGVERSSELMGEIGNWLASDKHKRSLLRYHFSLEQKTRAT